MKKSLMVLLCVVLCMFAFSAGICAADVTSGVSGDVNWNYDSAAQTLTFSLPEGKESGKMDDYNAVWKKADWTTASYAGKIKKIVVENGVTVGTFPFNGCSGVTEVEFKGTLTALSDGMFYGCSSLKEYTIPATVTKVGNNAFQLCTSLTDITIPDTVTSVGTSVFEGCTGLKKVTLPGSMTAIPNSTFSGCTSLESFTISDKVTSIGNKVFQGCTSLKTMVIPDSVTTIGTYAFSKCTGLTSLKLPNGLTKIPDYFVQDCTSLSSLELPASVTDIGSRAFSGSGLTTIQLPSTLTKIPNYLFQNCAALEKVTIPASVTSIGTNAFQGCKSLTAINLPEGLISIGMQSFDGCEKLGDVTFPESLKTIATYSFKDCKSLTKISLPAQTEITQSGGSFMGCTGLTEATICFKSGSAYFNVFSGCTNLKKVTFLDGSTTFGSGTFISTGSYGSCTALEEVVIPTSLTDWGDGAFDRAALSEIKFTGAGAENFVKEADGTIYNKDKTVLMSVSLDYKGEFAVPASVTKIQSYCFANCKDLTKISFAENGKLTEIGSSAFRECTALTDVALPSTIVSLGSYAFRDCTALSSIRLSEGLEKVGSYAFYGCENLKELKLPSTLTSLGAYAVSGTAVEELVVPAKVTTLNSYQFKNSAALKNVVILGDVTKIPSNMFSGCASMESLTLPKTVSSLNSLDPVSVVYFEGTDAQWSAMDPKGTKYKGTVICNYKRPTTEKGKLEVAEYPKAIVSNDAEELKTKSLSLTFRYPEGFTAELGDTIQADWYYATSTPSGLKGLKYLSGETVSGKDLTSTLTLSAQGESGQTGTWYYVCIAYKTDAQGNTTMLVTNPMRVLLKGEGFDLNGSGTEDDPFLIADYKQLCTVAEQVNGGNDYANTYFALKNDINVEKDWTPIGETYAFNGIFDGAGHTLTFAKGSKGLFGETNGTVQNVNLKGEYFTTSALAAEASGTINNCKLLSGSATQKSGLIGGSGGISIMNCEVESGVKVGWNAEENASAGFGSIGSIIGSGAYHVTSCKSAATVYGVHYVGGIAGSNGYSMRGVSIRNCNFTGEIIASGDYIGGIMGGGYDCHTAPNTKATNVENCYVNAKIIGRQAVGGIFGGERGLDQCWDNGVGYVRNNLFYGSLTLNHSTENLSVPGCTSLVDAENVIGSCGGIIGFMRSLNRCTVVENNFYYDANGCSKAIGGVEHIDTSAKAEMGMGEDGIFYYDTSRDSISDIKEFVDKEDKNTGDWQYTSVCKEDYNRTDDPMGKDAANLGRNCTVEEMKDGTVLKLLNSSASSMKNWIMPEGAVCPVLSDEAVVTEIVISGEYKTEYYIGESLDMTGAVFTATYSDGKTKEVSVDEITFTGFDSSQRAVLSVIAACGNATTAFEVKIVKNTAVTFEVSFTLLGDSKHGDLEEGEAGHTLADETLTTWIERKTYTVAENSTVWDLLQVVAKENGNVTFHTKAGNNNYVSYVTFNGETLGEFDNGTNSGWMYILNGRHPLLGVQEQFLEPGDEIVWHYTDNYTVEDPADDARVAVMETIKLIDAIGEVTKDSKEAIDAARAAYDALGKEQQAKVTNYEVLTAAEAVYDELTRVTPVEPVEPGVEVIDPADLPFTDLTENWYKEAVAYVYSYELMNGMSATTFEPQTTLTRAMVATILYRMEGEPAVNNSNSFGDVKNDVDGAWYYNAVLWATQNGIVEGYEDGTFRPVREITREEMAAMMYRYAEYKGLDVSATAHFDKFSDGAKVSAWAKPYMSWAVGVNLITGHDNGTLEPQGTATRAQAATVLMRFNEMVK